MPVAQSTPVERCLAKTTAEAGYRAGLSGCGVLVDSALRGGAAQGEAEGEGGAVAAATFDGGAAAVDLRDVLHDRQAQTRAALLAGAAFVHAVEALEHPVDYSDD